MIEMYIGERVAQVRLLGKEDNRVRVTVDDNVYEVDIVVADNGTCTLLYGGRSFNMEVTRDSSGRRMKVNQGFNSHDVEIVDAQEKYLRSRRRDDGRQDDTVCAPMPGKVVKINVVAGDRASEGDVLVVFEAMKMQSNLKVAGGCTVREVLVGEGDTVAAGQILIKLDIE